MSSAAQGRRELPPEHPARRQVEEGSAAAHTAMPSVKLPLPDRECAFFGCSVPSPCPDHEMSAEMREVFADAGHRCSPKCLAPLTWQANEHATALLAAKIKVRRG